MNSRSFSRTFKNRKKDQKQLAFENFEKEQLQSLTKAVNPVEMPVKQKHVRTLIMGTFRDCGAKMFWNISQRLPLLENHIIAWKFCHTLHRVLRDGHPQVLDHSCRQKDKLINMSQLWRHLHHGYGKLIELYCQLLLTKLTFHSRNPKLQGNLVISHSELESIYQKDVNNYFQISVEMFDYLDAILNLQSEIFNSLNATNSTSMTDSSQCRLSPLIPCIQDAVRLYDICVKVLFELHAAEIPVDTLVGHQDRFLDQFQKLKHFYGVISTMHYFRKLITVPNLPDKPPNFLEKIELKTYITPKEVLIPSNDDNDTISDTSVSDTVLIDVSTTMTNGHSANQELLIEKDVLISHLENQISFGKMEHYKDKENWEKIVQSLTLNVNDLKCQINDLGSQLEAEKRSKEEIFQQFSQISETSNLEKSKGEKFEQLKAAYSTLREEHINLLRKNAEVEKKYLKIEKDKLALTEEKTELMVKINDFMDEKRMYNDLKHDFDVLKTSSSEEIHALNEIIKYLEETNNGFLRENNVLVSNNESLKNKCEEFEQSSSSYLDEIDNLTKYKNVFKSCLMEAECLVQNTLEEFENPALSALTCSPDYLLVHSQNVYEVIDEFKERSVGDPSIVYRLINVLALHLIYTKATANTSPDLNVSDQIIILCKSLGANLLKLLSEVKITGFDKNTCIDEINDNLKAIADQAEKLQGVLKHSNLDILPELLENELQAMEKAIEQATKTIQDLIENSRRADNGKKLEVNAKILDKCQNLMDAIRKLIWSAKQLQLEIVSQGRGLSSVSEFYKKNHRWTDGLISAAKAIAVAANFFLSVADEIVNGKGKLEKLVVAAQEIVASSAQLVVASRVKADRNSANLKELSKTSKLVSKATASIVATVKDCSQLIDEDELDTSGLSLHDTKRLEMESQVRVLELEKNLEQERLHLSALRRRHYQMDNI